MKNILEKIGVSKNSASRIREIIEEIIESEDQNSRNYPSETKENRTSVTSQQEKNLEIDIQQQSRLEKTPPVGEKIQGIRIAMEFKEMIQKAEETIDIINFIIHDVSDVISETGDYRIHIGLLNILTAAADRGVKIRIITRHPDEFNSEDIDLHRTFLSLISDVEGVSILYCKDVHIKLMIVDQKKVFFGSVNFTGAGLKGKNECVTLTEHKEDVMGYLKSFNERWKRKSSACLQCREKSCEKYS